MISMATVNQVLDLARVWLSKVCIRGGKEHSEILSIYNSHKPLARGYKVKPTDSWCMTFISCLFIQAKSTTAIGETECSCQNAINICKNAGLWRQGSTQIPKPGDIIFYDWERKGGWSDHVGIVESVSGMRVKVIEGNKDNRVGMRIIDVGNPCIIGYARPRYTVQETPATKPLDVIAQEVINGKWGNGVTRSKALIAAGYDPTSVQNKVNQLLAKS